MLKYGKASSQSDVWSFGKNQSLFVAVVVFVDWWKGVTLFEIFSAKGTKKREKEVISFNFWRLKVPFGHISDERDVEHTVCNSPDGVVSQMLKVDDESIQRVIDACLYNDPSSRPTFLQIEQAFTKMTWPQ